MRAAQPTNPYRQPMTAAPLFVGIDLAWVSKNRTGLAAVDDLGRLIHSGSAHSDGEIAHWINDLPGQALVIAVDAPLIVPNATGQRVCERDISRSFGKYSAGPYSSSRAITYFDPPRAATLARSHSWSADPERTASVEQPQCIEVYPHPAMVGIFQLGERILYKKGPERARGFAQVIRSFETISALSLESSPRWQELKRIAASPGPGDLNRIEDEIDAILCAHLAWLWHHHRQSLQVYGSMADGYIIAPPPPSHPPVKAHRDDSAGRVSFEVAGQPGTFATRTGETWCIAVEQACAELAPLPPEARLQLDVEFRIPPRRSARDEWDLDNLLKPTIDALAPIIGHRPVAGRPQADDERIDKVVAVKRRTDDPTSWGASITISIFKAAT